MNWTQPICESCWERKNPTRNPVRLKEAHRKEERCAFCGTGTRGGIYVRVNPNSVPFAKEEIPA